MRLPNRTNSNLNVGARFFALARIFVVAARIGRLDHLCGSMKAAAEGNCDRDRLSNP